MFKRYSNLINISNSKLFSCIVDLFLNTFINNNNYTTIKLNEYLSPFFLNPISDE